MVWQKTVSDKHIYDWRVFSLEDGSILRMALCSLIIGIVYGILVAKIWPGLPGNEMRHLAGKWETAVQNGAVIKDQVCHDFPNSGACRQTVPATKKAKSASGGDTCAADFATWNSMPDSTSAEHNEKYTRLAEMKERHGHKNFASGCHDK